MTALYQLEERCFSGDRMSRRSLAHHIASPRAIVSVAVDAEHSDIAAYILMLSHAQRRDDRLYSLAVAPTHRGRGLAGQLLQECERLSHAPNLYLEVRTDNDTAIALYQRLGFRETARRKSYYQDGMDALVMIKSKSQ
ncbi:GNAT family N-acetyltransferase [Algimonas arctica]